MRLAPSRWLPFEEPIRKVQEEIDRLAASSPGGWMEEDPQATATLRELEERKREATQEVFRELTPYQKVLLARHPRRPYTLDYISYIFDDFIELHGDRRFGDDRALIGGPARLGDIAVMLLGHQKGRTTRERQERNFGMTRAEGYRKAQRFMSLAERLGYPVITLVDTPAADCLLEAESRGISEAIADTQTFMAQLSIPIVVVIIGEGGSGGAIAIAVGDRVLMLEYAIYSVIPPEGFSQILWRTDERAEEASAIARVTAADALELGIIDEVIPEPLGGAHANGAEMAARIKEALTRQIHELLPMPPDQLVAQRYEKFRRMGVWTEAPSAQ